MTLLVVGTDTEVGKTIVSALLLVRYGRDLPTAYWKPVATGWRVDGEVVERDVETVARLAGVPVGASARKTARPMREVLPETALYERPLSPHLAARLEGERLDLSALDRDHVRHAERQARRAGGLLVEGVGGLLVPLTDDGPLLVDWLAGLHAPCLVVARSGLGTINHTLLTLEALGRRGVAVAGVVLVGPENRENRRAIERFSTSLIASNEANAPQPIAPQPIEVVAELPWLDPLTPEALARQAERFDPDGRLVPLVRCPGEPLGAR